MVDTDPSNYNLFLDFLDTLSGVGFRNIDRNHPLMMELEEIMEARNQFFYIGDLMQMKILFSSRGSLRMIGIEPGELNLNQFMELTHPDELQRLCLGRTLVIKLGQELYQAERGTRLLSTNFRMRNPSGEYSHIIVQCYFMYSPGPTKCVYFLKLHTNVDWYKRKKQKFHYYLGEDLSMFRYPDKELMETGILLSEREFEIIKLVAEGLNSEQIAEKLFLSINTVHTHRTNMLKKTGKENTSDLIFILKERVLK